MTTTTVAQHTTQPLNFGPEWLRALSTPDSATSIPSSGGSGSGNIFKFSATKYRYSKDEILALRVNVSERLSEEIQNEIMENLKDVESVFRSNAMDPIALTAPTPEETAKMSALSSYISGRTPGGAGRAGNNSQQSQQDSRNSRGGSSMSNGRGGSRGRGGRDNTYGSNRGNTNNSDENGENGNTGDETSGSSSSWSRGSHHSRGGSFGSRVRSYDDRDQPQSFRRGSTRQTSEGWRRSRGDDDDNNNEQNEDTSTPVNGSTSWTSRGGQARRGGSNGSMEQRTKSSDKWNYNDDRSGSSNNYETNQQRSGGWRTNSSMSDRDRDLNSRRPQPKRERMPEWMDDNNDDDDDNHLANATFEQDGTFTRASTVRQNNNNNNNEQQKTPTQSPSTPDESLTQSNTVVQRQDEEIKPEKPTVQTDTPVVNMPAASEPTITTVSQPKPSVQQPIRPWDDDFDHSDVATTVVEATLAEDYDYSPPISNQQTSRLMSMESNSSTVPSIPQQQQQSQQRTSVVIDDKQWFYKDPQNTVQGPFSSADMERWFAAGYFTVLLPVKRLGETQFSTIQQLTKDLGRLPFRTDVSSLPQTPVQKQQQPIAPEPQKFNPMAFTSSSASASNNAFFDDYMMQQQPQQQQSRQNVQHSLLFNRQASMPLSTNDRKPMSSPSSISSQLQAYFNSQQQSSSSSSPLFQSNLANDPATIYQQQQQQQYQRSVSSTNSSLYDDMQRSFRPPTSTNNNNSSSSSYYPQQQQQSNDIMSRLTQAMQVHGKERRLDDQRHDYDLERLKFYQQQQQQPQQTRLQREEEEKRRQLKYQQELANNRQSNLDQLTKSMENKKQSTMDIDQFPVYQQLIQYQKEQQAKIEAQQIENMRRYQQQYREQSQPSTMFKMPDTMNWNRHSSQNNDLNSSLNFTDMQKQEQEQERRSREAAAFAHQYVKTETLPTSNLSSSSSLSASNNKTSSWARTLFADSNNANSHNPSASSHIVPDHNTNDLSSITSYNQQATNAPKSQPITNQQSTPWNGPNTSLQNIQQQQQPMTSTPGWGNNVQQTSSTLFWDKQHSSLPNIKPGTPWTELKPTTPSTNIETTKTDNEVKDIFSTTRTQEVLVKWTQNQFKDNLKDVDVPTLVQLLKDIHNPGEIMEYVQPYIGSVSNAKEFANNFLAKRNQLINAEPDLDNDRLSELVMAPTSSHDTSGSGGDEGFQIASSNGQKKKARKMKGQKVDVKQLGFIVNNAPEQRDDIEQVPM